MWWWPRKKYRRSEIPTSAPATSPARSRPCGNIPAVGRPALFLLAVASRSPSPIRCRTASCLLHGLLASASSCSSLSCRCTGFSALRSGAAASPPPARRPWRMCWSRASAASMRMSSRWGGPRRTSGCGAGKKPASPTASAVGHHHHLGVRGHAHRRDHRVGARTMSRRAICRMRRALPPSRPLHLISSLELVMDTQRWPCRPPNPQDEVTPGEPCPSQVSSEPHEPGDGEEQHEPGASAAPRPRRRARGCCAAGELPGQDGQEDDVVHAEDISIAARVASESRFPVGSR